MPGAPGSTSPGVPLARYGSGDPGTEVLAAYRGISGIRSCKLEHQERRQPMMQSTNAPKIQIPTLPSFCPEAPALAPSLIAWSFGLTDRGKVRPKNEDQFLIAALARALCIQQSSLREDPVQYADADGQLLVVADGMGGHAGGAEASALALNAIEDFMLQPLKGLFALGASAENEKIDVLGELRTALRRADARVCEAASQRPELHGMGTTLTMAYTHGSELFVAHVGDSRCYLFRGGVLYQLTQDHT